MWVNIQVIYFDHVTSDVDNRWAEIRKKYNLYPTMHYKWQSLKGLQSYSLINEQLIMNVALLIIVFVKDASLYFTSHEHRRHEIVVTSAKHKAECSTNANEGAIYKT